MARMQSMQSQCCCCAISVFSALFGIIMLSTGVCLVLNYRIMEVDTTGLPPEWRNEEGKKIVGIILICCGIAGMGMSALITVLYFTVCSRPKTKPAVAPSGPVPGHATGHGPRHSTGHGGGKSNNHSPHTTDPYSTEVNGKPNSKGRRGKRSTKKRPHLKTYKNNLTTHREVINESEPRYEHFDLDESSQSLDSCQTASSRTTSSGTAQDIIETSLKIKQQSVPPVILNVDHLPQLPTQETGMLKTMPPPPIPSASVEIDSEEEEVSQIEEIKKLDKQVAGLLK
ncbi:uncharacterized protein [Haliotis cracherodii]|uniref:uncharacterized protein n=1 Tax=Haliotis cracherodii TaxID=6455 RepID=UPI0039EC42C8